MSMVMMMVMVAAAVMMLVMVAMAVMMVRGEGSNGSDDGGDDKSNLTWSVEAVGEALEKRLEASSRRLSRGHGYQQCLQSLLGGKVYQCGMFTTFFLVHVRC